MNKKTVYLDMDGVIADFDAGIKKILGYSEKDTNIHYPDSDWAKIRKNQRLYLDLPRMPDAQRIIDIARVFRDKLNWNLLFLSAIPAGNDMPWSFWDKCQWAQKHYPDIPVHFGPYAHDKHKHCKPGDILVDDRSSSIIEWKNAGGLAVEVKVNRYQDAIIEFDQLLYDAIINHHKID